MKKAIFTLAFLTTIKLLATAHPFSVLNLSVFGNSNFTMQLDQQYYSNPDRFYSIHSVTPGRHFLRVVKHTYGYRGVLQQEVFAGFVNVPANSVMNLKIARYGRLDIKSILPLCEANDIYTPDYINCSYTNQPLAPLNMSASDFNYLKSSLMSKSFDSTRLQIALQALNSNYLSAGQVKELMSLMTFESTKLDFAKAAFNKTIDQQNYFLTYDALTFESSIEELVHYIQSAG